MQERLDDYKQYKRIYLIPYDVFVDLGIQTWRYNRPPDATRVAEIREKMTEIKHLDGLINLAYIPKEGLVCYEGNHRRLALVPEVKYVLCDILWDAATEQVEAEFRRLNKCIPVPDIYVSNDANHKLEIQEAVASFCKKYALYASASPKPNRPNFNRDNLTDQFSRLCDELKMTPAVLMEKLGELNHEYSTKDHSRVPPKIVEKCRQNGLWLFVFSTSIPTRHLE
jgi:hypothetical protein